MRDEQLDSSDVVGSSGDVAGLNAAGLSDRLANDSCTAERLGVVGADGAGVPAAACDDDSATSTAVPAVDVLSGAGACGDGRGGGVLPCMACARWLELCDGFVCATEVPTDTTTEGGLMARVVAALVMLLAGCLLCLSFAATPDRLSPRHPLCRPPHGADQLARQQAHVAAHPPARRGRRACARVTVGRGGHAVAQGHHHLLDGEGQVGSAGLPARSQTSAGQSQ